jgi:hypothetical protein
MKTKKAKIVIFCLLVLLGAAFFTYGVFFHSTNVTAQQDDSTVLAKSESSLIQEVSIGGVTRDASGNLRQTYTGEPPKACPT